MGDARKRYPSLPSNYISIIQLKERWMREQEQQQKKEQEQKGDLHKPREEKEGIQNTTASRFTAPPQFRPKRNKYHWVVKVSSQKPEGSEVQKGHREIKVSAQKQELKIKEDLRRVEAWKKPRAEEELAGGTVQQVSRNGNDKKFPGRVNQMAGMYQRMEKLSMKPEKVGGSTSTDVSAHRWNPAFSRRFSRQKATDAGLVWVRKGDSSAEAILLGFQHYLLTLGITVLIPSILVPQMGGGNDEKARAIQTLLFVSGLNTLLQSFLGTRLPNMVVGSYAFLVPATSILLSKRYNKFEDPLERYEQTMRGIQGALIATSFFQMIVGFLGLWRNVVRLISPLSAVPLVTSTAVGLYHLGFPMLGRCVEVGCPELILMVFISQYVPHFMKSKRAIYDRYAMLFSVPIVWSYAHILTASGVYDGKPPNTQISCRTDRSGLVGGSPWIRIPSPFQWGTPTFNAGEAFAMMAASFVALIESTGTFIATSRYGSATPIPPSVISRGAGWLGIGVLLNGFFGAVTGSTISVENVGLLAVTRVGSRRVIQISAGFMIFFSVLGKFGAVFASIPLPIIAALYCVFFAYVFSSGLGFLQFCNLNSFRTKFILGFSIFMGFSIPQYLKEYQLSSRPGHVHTNSGPFNDMMTVIFMSNATVAAMIALLLDTTLSWGKDGGSNDSGSHWWRKFSSYNSDVRSDEFYALPFKLNKFFPAH